MRLPGAGRLLGTGAAVMNPIRLAPAALAAVCAMLLAFAAPAAAQNPSSPTTPSNPANPTSAPPADAPQDHTVTTAPAASDLAVPDDPLYRLLRRLQMPQASGPVKEPPADAAVIVVHVPDASAEVLFDGERTYTAGTTRLFRHAGFAGRPNGEIHGVGPVEAARRKREAGTQNRGGGGPGPGRRFHAPGRQGIGRSRPALIDRPARRRQNWGMEPTQELIDALFRDKVLAARQMSPDDKLLAGPRLFARSCRIMKDGIRRRASRRRRGPRRCRSCANGWRCYAAWRNAE